MRERLGVVRDLLIERPKGSAGREWFDWVWVDRPEVGMIVDLHTVYMKGRRVVTIDRHWQGSRCFSFKRHGRTKRAILWNDLCPNERYAMRS